MSEDGEWDVFISHASEDKNDFVRPLAEGLRALDLRVWYDELTLKVGDSLRESIDHGLGQSRFGIVVLSQHFFSKQWPQNELDGLLAREVDGLKVILPVWHKITRAQVEGFSPVLAGRVAARSEQGLDQVIEALAQAIGTSAIESKSPWPAPLPEPHADSPPPSSGSGPDTVIRAWWKKGVLGVGLTAALTTVLVNLQVVKDWFIGDDRTSPVHLSPDPNRDADEHAAPQRLTSGFQTKSLDKEEPNPQTAPPVATESRTAASSAAPPTVLQQPAIDTGGSSVDPKLDEIVESIEKRAKSKKGDRENWSARFSNGRIRLNLKIADLSVTRPVDRKARDNLESLMASMRSILEDAARADEEYVKNLLEE